MWNTEMSCLFLFLCYACLCHLCVVCVCVSVCVCLSMYGYLLMVSQCVVSHILSRAHPVFCFCGAERRESIPRMCADAKKKHKRTEPLSLFSAAHTWRICMRAQAHSHRYTIEIMKWWLVVVVLFFKLNIFIRLILWNLFYQLVLNSFQRLIDRLLLLHVWICFFCVVVLIIFFLLYFVKCISTVHSSRSNLITSDCVKAQIFQESMIWSFHIGWFND